MVYRILGDDKDLEKSLNKAQKSLAVAGQKMKSIGKNLTLGLTAPIVGIGTAMVKSAIDAEETRAKFETAFDGITDVADRTVDNLQDGYGLARQEAEKLLSNTGDLLKGFGATADQALGLSHKTQQLAVDLASYNNLQGGAARASEIVTKAMLGEREGLTALGIKISEADVQQRLLEKGQEDLTGRALLLAKAQTTLELAYSQSGDALGDYNRTQDSTANQLRQLKADIKDISVQIGRELLPTVRAGLETVRGWIDAFKDLSTGNKDFIKQLLKVAGLLAASGPILIGLGHVTTAIKGLIGLMAASNPVGLIAVAIGAGVALAATTSEAERMQRSTDAVGKSFGDLRRMARDARGEVEATAQSAEEMVRQANIMGQRYTAMAEKTKEIKENQAAVTEELEEQQKINESYQEYWEGVNDRWKTLGQELSIYTDNLEQIKDLEDPERKLRELDLLEDQLQLDIGMLEQEEKFPVTAEARRALLEQIKAIQEDITQTNYEQIENTNEATIAMNDMRDAALQGADATSQWDQYIKDLKDDAEDISDVMISAADAAQDAWGGTFEALGEGLVDWEDGVEGLKEVYKDLFISILRALGEQFAAQAIAAFAAGNFVGAGMYTGASAAAYGSVGVISAFGEGGSFYADEPQVIMVGDKPEYVNIEPVDHVNPPGGGSGGGETYQFYGDIYGYEDFAEKVEQASSRAARIGRVNG